MKIPVLLGALLICGPLFYTPRAQAQTVSVVASSELAGVPLPSNTLSLAEQDVPHDVTDALETMMKAGGNKVTRGRTEVLAWAGGDYKLSHAKEYKARIGAALRKGGWTYEEGDHIEGTDGATIVTALKTTPSKHMLLGFWAPSKEALILAWTEVSPAQGAAPNGNTGIVPPGTPHSQIPPQDENTPTGETPTIEAPNEGTAANETPTGAVVLTLGDEQRVLNVMKNTQPKLPTFPALAPKAGKVCGFVKNLLGQPLKGAVIGIRSTAVGGAETSAEAKTDERGYYEILAPWGAAGFYCAGYTMDWGESRGAFGLCPADGEADEFATPQGHVENWVLVPYGIANRDDVADQPQYSNNYYGGSLTITYRNESSMFGSGLRDGTTVEIVLTPQGKLIDGSQGQTFVIRKVAHDGGLTVVHLTNIPAGAYRFSVRKADGGALHFTEFGPYRGDTFGLAPKTGQGSADLLLRPYSAQPIYATAAHGHWKAIDIEVFQ